MYIATRGPVCKALRAKSQREENFSVSGSKLSTLMIMDLHHWDLAR